jgi:hypothetical protein
MVGFFVFDYYYEKSKREKFEAFRAELVLFE